MICKRDDWGTESGYGGDLPVFLHWADGQLADDERRDSHIDVLRFRADFSDLFLFFCLCTVFRHRRVHRQQPDYLRYGRRCLYGDGGGVSCRYGDDGGRDCFGRIFGDKMSPLSDTTGISASIVGIDLFEHIKNMMYTTIPAWLISAALMLWLLPNVAAHDMNSVESFRSQLEATGLVHTYSLIPFVLLVVLAMMRTNAVIAMLFTVIVAVAVTYLHSTPDLRQLGSWFYGGYKLEGEAFKDVAKLISRGGLESMFFTQTIVILGMSLGGLLFALGVIPSLLEAIRTFLTNAGRATFSVAMTSVGVNFLIGEQYLSILLSGETFKPVYDKLGLHSRNLSRTLEDAGTVINPARAVERVRRIYQPCAGCAGLGISALCLFLLFELGVDPVIRLDGSDLEQEVAG